MSNNSSDRPKVSSTQGYAQAYGALADALNSAPSEKPRQLTRFKTDLKRRPKAYARDLMYSPAIKFAGGNLAYAGFLLMTTGANLGSVAAAIIQGGLTVFTGKKQMDATYQGAGFDAPYQVQGFASIATAAFILATGAYSYLSSSPDMPESASSHVITIDPQTIETSEPSTLITIESPSEEESPWSRMAFPAVTFSAWGLAHFAFGAASNRRKRLKKEGLSNKEANANPEVHAHVQKGEIAAGVADVTAIFKDKSLGEAAELIHKIGDVEIYSAPFSPENIHFTNSIVGLPLFLVGFYKSIHRGQTPIVGPYIDNMQFEIIESMPAPMRRALHLEEQKMTPVHFYAGGYCSTAVISAISAISDPVQLAFAAAGGLWGLGYHGLSAEHTDTPESADDYAIRMGLLEPAAS